MRRIDFDPKKLTGEEAKWWKQWEKEAIQATKEIIQKWETEKKLMKEDFDSKIWKKLKDWLLENVFDGKCAYCESELSRQYPDAEHYRPKAGVKYRVVPNQKIQMIVKTKDEQGNEIEHPGYFWLAYHWKNLLPSCELCNLGKMNLFPIEKDYCFLQKLEKEALQELQSIPTTSENFEKYHYLDSKDLNQQEQPYLLHPYFDDPEEHLLFDEYGGVNAKEDEEGNPSLKGQHSIQVYNLDEKKLRQTRRKNQVNANSRFSSAYNEYLFQGKSIVEAKQMAKKKMLDEWGSHKTPYTAAILDFLKNSFDLE